MKLDRHWWNTADGELVPDGDERARILAYPAGSDIPDEVARKLGILRDAEAEADAGGQVDTGETGADGGQADGAAAEAKMAAKPADKARAKPADKGSEA